jgi:hypothetical protein
MDHRRHPSPRRIRRAPRNVNVRISYSRRNKTLDVLVVSLAAVRCMRLVMRDGITGPSLEAKLDTKVR